MALIEARGLTKVYTMGDQTVHALRGVSLDIEEGEFVAIMGASGSGKSTLMNLLGCLDAPTAGRYLLDGEDVGTLSADRKADLRNRTLGFVFQNYSLLPRTTALDNVALPLEIAAYSRVEIGKRVRASLDKVGLLSRERSKPIMLSGGAAQTPGLLDELGERTGTPCTMLDSFRGVATGESAMGLERYGVLRGRVVAARRGVGRAGGAGPPAAADDVGPDDVGDGAVLEPRQHPAVVAHPRRLRRQQPRPHQHAADQHDRLIAARPRRHHAIDPRPAVLVLGQVAVANTGSIAWS